MIVVGYVRVSNESQRSNFSLPMQKDAIVKWCNDNKHTLLYTFEDVESAESADARQGFQMALSQVFEGKADGMVVYKYDRFCRSVLDSELLKARFKSAGKHLFSISDPVDWLTSDGNVFYQLKAVFAEHERNTIRQRCMAGKERKKLSGEFVGGQLPFGYDLVRGHLVKNEAELKALNLMMTLRDEGYTYKEITGKINETGVKTKRGKVFTPYSLRLVYLRRFKSKHQLPA